ncbi:hypothetical protein [Streptomyces jumonjinensis]|uniref:hypothetical protein n=1 Tax=Streptomyces jumonjinensis TaxID=1945 RepID=UPI0037AAF0A7
MPGEAPTGLLPPVPGARSGPVPPRPASAPYGIRPGTPGDPWPGGSPDGSPGAPWPGGSPGDPAYGGDRQPPAEFDSLFRTGPAAPPASAPAPYAAEAPPPPAPAPPARGGGGGSRRRARRPEPSRRRKPAGLPVIAAVVVGCAVLGLGAGALLFGGGDEGEPDPGAGAPAVASSPAPGDGAAGEGSSAPPADDPVKVQARALDRLLAESNDSRAAVVRSVADIRRCANLEQAATDLRGAAEQRRELVTRLGQLDVGELPEHEDLTESLTEAWEASALADDHYAAWADQAGSRKGCKKGKARHTQLARQGDRASGEATEAKQEASGLWNPIATRHGLPERHADQL